MKCIYYSASIRKGVIDAIISLVARNPILLKDDKIERKSTKMAKQEIENKEIIRNHADVFGSDAFCSEEFCSDAIDTNDFCSYIGCYDVSYLLEHES